MEGLRGVLSLEERLLANMCQQRMEWNQFEDIGGSERKDISRGSCRTRISQHKLHDTHVSLFLHRTKSAILFKEHSHLHGASNASSAFFRLCTHAVLVNNTRSGRWNAARERMKAVSFCFLCFLEKSQPRAWTWDNERELRR